MTARAAVVALFGLTSAVSVAFSAQKPASLLERALLELPPRYVADLPRANRPAFLARLSEHPGFDPKHRYFHWYSDGGDLGQIGLTSMLYIKVFRRVSGDSVVLTHMPKPFADGSTPRRNQTF